MTGIRLGRKLSLVEQPFFTTSSLYLSLSPSSLSLSLSSLSLSLSLYSWTFSSTRCFYILLQLLLYKKANLQKATLQKNTNGKKQLFKVLLLSYSFTPRGGCNIWIKIPFLFGVCRTEQVRQFLESSATSFWRIFRWWNLQLIPSSFLSVCSVSFDLLGLRTLCGVQRMFRMCLGRGKRLCGRRG